LTKSITFAKVMLMVTKTKKQTSAKDTISAAISNAGMLLMMASATMLMIDVPEHPNQRAILPGQPVLAVADQGGGNNTQRREREETGPHYVSYSASQRTPGRTGKA
jgi:hypothetical protein